MKASFTSFTNLKNVLIYVCIPFSFLLVKWKKYPLSWYYSSLNVHVKLQINFSIHEVTS